MKEFYVRTKRVWVKVSRRADKSFVFATGYTGEAKAFRINSYPKEFMPTRHDAKSHAATIAADYI